MPLFIDLAELPNNVTWPPEIFQVVEAMQADLGANILRPQSARRLITQHLDPLFPDSPPSYFIPVDHPTWKEIEHGGKQYSGMAENWPQRSAAELVTLLPIWAKGSKPKVKSLQNYCELCWRHSLDDKKFCADHDQQISQAGYRRGYRLKPYFHAAIESLRDAEKDMVCRNAWDNVLAHPEQLSTWLHQYRPLTFQELHPHLTGATLDFYDLLSLLDRPHAETSIQSLSNLRANLHAWIVEDPQQLFGMLRRCEAWHQVRINKPHGGYRPNAGRKPSR